MLFRSDDLFTVAVDAMLNLDADLFYLDNALIQIYTRIAASPDKVFFYRLAVDILSEIAGSSDFAEILLAASIHSPDSRASLLQEIHRGATHIQTDALLDYGMVLVFMDTHLPPQACIELGKSFLERGDYKTARFLFHRTRLLFEDSGLCLDIADGYDRAGMFEQAGLLIREALMVMPDNLDLLIRRASYDEIQGRFDDAWQGYLRTYQLSLNSLTASAGDGGSDKRRSGRNVQAEDRSRKTALYGLLATLTSPVQKEETFRYFEESIASLYPQAVSSNGKSPADARLLQLWKDYELLCLATENAARANPVVKKMLPWLSGKPDAVTEAIRNRIAAGDVQMAMELAQGIGTDRLSEDVQGQLAALQNAQDAPSRGLMNAALTGDSAEAFRRIDELLLRPKGAWDDAYPAAVAAAMFFDNPEYLKRLIAKRVSGLANETSAKRLTAARSLLTMVWPMLSEPDRRWLSSQIAETCAQDKIGRASCRGRV